MPRFSVRKLHWPASAFVLACATLCGSAGAQTLSDELQVVSSGTTTTFTANEPTSGFESILAFANTTPGSDDSASMTSVFVSGSGASATFNQASATSWFNHQKNTAGTFYKETGLTDPGSTAVSDVMLSFMQVVNGSNVNVIALISDPTLVADILAISTPTATVAETGALQDVTTLVFPGTAPFTVQVLSAVPETESWLLLLGGLGAIALARRRRTH